jgi:DNA-binding LytR/AlgR family response regulator
MTILIIEDEEPTARKLQRLLTQVEPAATVVGTTGSVEESVEWLRSNPKPELIFMDIELADGQSFDIFNQTTVSSPVIFTTAYDEYAINAFKVNSIDYLLKPITESALRQALAKLHSLTQVLLGQTAPALSADFRDSLTHLFEQFRSAQPGPASLAERANQPTPFRDRFMIKQGQRLFSIGIQDVAYVFSRNKMSFLKTRDGQEWLLDYTMDELAQMLEPRRFFRLNRQVITELRAVDKAHVYFNGKLKITLSPAFDEEVIVSREKAGDFKQWLGE